MQRFFNKIDRIGILLFFYGVFSATQIYLVGYIGISETLVFLIAPFIYFKDRNELRHDGFSIYIYLSLCCIFGCVCSGLWNNASVVNIVKIVATTYSLFAHVVVLHRLLRKDPGQLKWIFLGIAISRVISIFIFQPGSAHNSETITNEDLISSVTGYALFWVSQISTWVSLPIKMYYLFIPFWYSLGVPLFCSIFAIFTTTSGRSTFFVLSLSVLLILMDRKGKASMHNNKKNNLRILLSLVIVAFSSAMIYKYCAKEGYLGQKHQEKYQKQTTGRKGLIGILMGGRLEFFIGATAALHHPIMGIGPKAEDKEGLVMYFMNKYGTDEDLWRYIGKQNMMIEQGVSGAYIPAHSHIIAFWLWCGLPGIIFWIYALYLIYITIKKSLFAIPHWYGYFALTIPTITMGIFFSPFGDRIGVVLFMTACLLSRAVAENKISLPKYMIMEIQQHG